MSLMQMRTPPQRMEPVALAVGDSVQFAESKRWWRVRATSDRYVILTSPFNLRHTVLYTIIDWERGVRGPDDMVFGFGYETPEQIAENMDRLLAGDMEVSHRACSIRVRLVGQVTSTNRECHSGGGE
jgi:hypothetical protein